ncbi:hypothetical protein NDU88_002763 [Pleurodeles waltl]|uniref:Uncharacterized protein n=1 Tax=Pleurodeles waltl TaxID=8319 RepID=A0AAV7UDZ8_PLEWA|nr:hypothetical protein NDU88_002763 [Pleurodeles waltl]
MPDMNTTFIDHRTDTLRFMALLQTSMRCRHRSDAVNKRKRAQTSSVSDQLAREEVVVYFKSYAAVEALQHANLRQNVDWEDHHPRGGTK